MAFLTSRRGSGSTNVARAFERADQTAISIKASAIVTRDKTQAGTVNATDLIDGFLANLQRGKVILQAAAAVAGVGSYAAEQYADVPGYNIGTEFTNMMNEVNTTITFFEVNYPKDADGNLKLKSFVGDGTGNTVPYAGFSAGQRTAIANRLTALIAAID